MKKYFLTFIALFSFLFLLSGIVNADFSADPNPNTGLVPCGTGSPYIPSSSDPNKMIQNPAFHRCELSDIAKLVRNIFDFIVWKISTPLAGLLVVLGGILILLSGASPQLASRGKQILWSALIGILLIYCSWLIVNGILLALGFSG